MSIHLQLTKATSVKVHVADRNNPWERCINESYNGLLLLYLPKVADFLGFTQKKVDEIAKEPITGPKRNRWNFVTRSS